MSFELDRVTFRYQETPVFDGLTLPFQENRRSALLGANGSGKSTLLRLLDGLYFPEAGEIRFLGQTLSEHAFVDDRFHSWFRRRVGFVFQNPDVQLFSATVFDEVAFAPLQLGMPDNEVRERVEACMAFWGITHLGERPPYRLSGGEKKRVALASVLVTDPEVLLLDEPMAALDPRSQMQILELLAGWSGGKKTVIVATHDLATLPDMADEVYVLDSGKLLAAGSPESVLSNRDLLAGANLLYAPSDRKGRDRQIVP